MEEGLGCKTTLAGPRGGGGGEPLQLQHNRPNSSGRGQGVLTVLSAGRLGSTLQTALGTEAVVPRTFHFTPKPRNRNPSPPSPASCARALHCDLPTRSAPAVWPHCLLRPRAGTPLCSGWKQEPGGLCFHLSATPPLGAPLHAAPRPLNTEAAAGGGLGLGPRRGEEPTPIPGRAASAPAWSRPRSRGPRSPARRSAPAAWPASPHQCQLLTLVASARSSTIQRGSPSPHLAIGFPIAPSPGPEQPQQPPQYRLVPSSPSNHFNAAWSEHPAAPRNY